MADVTGVKLSVVAKMRCVERRDSQHGADAAQKTTTVRLQPVYAESGVNATWSKYTPSGQVEMQISNPAAVEAFQLGKCYLVSFSETAEEL
jgi:hypothetical protein